MATLNPSVCAWTRPRSMHARARSRVRDMSGNLDPDLAALDRHRIAGHPRAPRGHHALAGPYVVHPAVPGTGEPRAREPPLAERPALVGALVVACEDFVSNPRQHDGYAVGLDQLQLSALELIQTRDATAAHASSFTTNARYRPVMYCQRISVAWRTASTASACRSAVVQ